MNLLLRDLNSDTEPAGSATGTFSLRGPQSPWGSLQVTVILCHHFLAACPWASHITSLDLSFLKMGTTADTKGEFKMFQDYSVFTMVIFHFILPEP